MKRTSPPHGKGTWRAGWRASSLVVAVALFGCRAPQPVIALTHFDELRELARELHDAHQGMAASNRAAYFKLVTAQGQARLDSEHAGCTIRLLGIANARLQSCEASVIDSHIERNTERRRAFRQRISQLEARELIGEGDFYRQSLEAQHLLADLEESAVALSAAMQVGSSHIRRKVAASLAQWGTDRLESRAGYEGKVRGLFDEFKNGEGKDLRQLLAAHDEFGAKVDEIEDAVRPPKAENGVPTTGNGPIRFGEAQKLPDWHAWAVEHRLRHYVAKRNRELMELELLALGKRCQQAEDGLRQLPCERRSTCD